jgi:hypothetical protein
MDRSSGDAVTAKSSIRHLDMPARLSSSGQSRTARTVSVTDYYQMSTVNVNSHKPSPSGAGVSPGSVATAVLSPRG